MAGDKIVPGLQEWSPRAIRWNAMVDSSDAYLRQKHDGGEPKNRALYLPTDVLRVHLVESSGDFGRGAVVGIGPLSVDELTRYDLVFDWEEPAAGSPWGLTLATGEEGDVIPVQCDGVCLALVDVLDVDHRFAKFVAGENHLDSAHWGHVRLLSRPDGTGEQEIAVSFPHGQKFFIGKASGTDIDPFGTGSIDVHTGASGSEVASGDLETVYNGTGIIIEVGAWAKVTEINGHLYAEPWECPSV